MLPVGFRIALARRPAGRRILRPVGLWNRNRLDRDEDDYQWMVVMSSIIMHATQQSALSLSDSQRTIESLSALFCLVFPSEGPSVLVAQRPRVCKMGELERSV
jgi:hypothetical protein